jgi:hypothetical protein
MAKSLVALGTAAAIGAAALTTSTPAAAQAWIAPVIVISGAVVGPAVASPYYYDPYYQPYARPYYQGYAEPYEQYAEPYEQYEEPVEQYAEPVYGGYAEPYARALLSAIRISTLRANRRGHRLAV